LAQVCRAMVVFPALCVAATARTFYVPAAPPAAQLATHPALLAEAELPRAALRGAPVSAYAASSSEASSLSSLAVFGVGCAAGYALLSVAGARAQGGARRRSAGAVMQTRADDDPATMITKGGQYMYDQPFAPPTMGREYIQADVRKPLSEYVGASAEFNLGKWLAGEKEETFEPWDPLNLCLLSKVSANNPDVAFLREAELKHGRIAMLAFVGILFTAGGTHFSPPEFEAAAAAGWPEALGTINKSNPGILAQALATIALVEGVSNANRAGGAPDMFGATPAAKTNWWDGLWFGEREGNPIVAGDLKFDPLKLMPKDPDAAKRMQLAELKNGRLAMIAVFSIFQTYLYTGKSDLF